MKIRSITLDNVRRFTEAVRVGEIGDGLNVLSEPNEQGKSTLFDAIQALFFKSHTSRDKDVTALRPYAGGGPEVSVELDVDEDRFVVKKRWLQKPVATVHSNGSLIAQADEAEAWIANLLGDDTGGPSGLIWVRQGMTDLTGGSTKEQKAALEARRDLMSSVGEEVEAMTGGRRMDAALARCREELAEYATKTGRPYANGPWKAAQDLVVKLAARREDLAATAHDLQKALAERKRARQDLRELEDPVAAVERRQKLEAAQAAYTTAERHAQELEAEARKVDMARLTADNARNQLESFQVATSERTVTAQNSARAEAEARETKVTLEKERAARDEAERSLEITQEAHKKAQVSYNLAIRAKAARDGAERRDELTARIVEAEKARSKMEAAAAEAKSGPDAKTISEIEGLAAAHATAVAARDATATQVIAHYAEGCHGAIRSEKSDLLDGQVVPIMRTTRLTIDGVGELEIHPSEFSHDDSSVDTAAALRKALEGIGANDIDGARASAAARADAERRQGEAKAVLKSLAPDGLDPLREAMAKIPELDADLHAPTPEEAEIALEKTRTATVEASAARDAASDRVSDARDEATRAETKLNALVERLKRADDALTKYGDSTEADLLAEASRTAEALQAAEDVHKTKVQNAPDLATTEAALNRAVSVDQSARDEIIRLKPLLATLDERVSRSSGDAVEERLAETEQQLEAAQITLARIEREVAVLLRLEKALETARSEARERYFAPIAKELKPLLHLLWPEAKLTWGEESLLPDTLIRNGQQEPIDILSGGTQEQVALLVRLAFARMLAAAGRVAPIILDDALVFTDDDRIERMFDALHRQAGDLQIIVLTCRQRAFRALGGKALHLAHLTDTETTP
ncbi:MULTISPECIES: AAA family ATPase [unclassified Ruegeria]|uniref:AAA family ATPase n=1 Tax=unclassified Ruegeria TaxID=2625375 RepID=UPI001492B949|nr:MULTISPECIES: AAA family ATPase [unclassified Ruegeria]NOD36638.1 AAA family ATPase [Ruegeria sp. HKCCD7296]NOE43863.1 AAA family ATPase [Ruegeria sp. HKCCD7319]